jgi:hypothetical protein
MLLPELINNPFKQYPEVPKDIHPLDILSTESDLPVSLVLIVVKIS